MFASVSFRAKRELDQRKRKLLPQLARLYVKAPAYGGAKVLATHMIDSSRFVGGRTLGGSQFNLLGRRSERTVFTGFRRGTYRYVIRCVYWRSLDAPPGRVPRRTETGPLNGSQLPAEPGLNYGGSQEQTEIPAT